MGLISQQFLLKQSFSLLGNSSCLGNIKSFENSEQVQSFCIDMQLSSAISIGMYLKSGYNIDGKQQGQDWASSSFQFHFQELIFRS